MEATGYRFSSVKLIFGVRSNPVAGGRAILVTKVMKSPSDTPVSSGESKNVNKF